MKYNELFNPTEEHGMLRDMVAFTTQRSTAAAKHDELGVLNVPLFRQLTSSVCMASPSQPRTAAPAWTPPRP